MSIFGKRTVVFREKNRSRWEQAKAALKEAQIPVAEARSFEEEQPICGCGARLDVRDFGAGGKIDRSTYYVAVKPEYAAQAEELLRSLGL